VSYQPNPATFAVLDPGPLVPAEHPSRPAPILDRLLGDVDGWPDRGTAALCRESLHHFDLDRAARPPDVHVHLAGVPGVFAQMAGSPVRYIPEQP